MAGVCVGIFLASESEQLLTATLESPRVDSECPKHAKSLPVIISFLPRPSLALIRSLRQRLKIQRLEEFAAVNLLGLLGFLHLIALAPVLCACLTECSSSVLSKITFIHPTQALVCQLCQHTPPPYRTEPSVTEAPGRSGSGSLGQASWGTGRQQSVCRAAGVALIGKDIVGRIIMEAGYLSR